MLSKKDFFKISGFYWNYLKWKGNTLKQFILQINYRFYFFFHLIKQNKEVKIIKEIIIR